MNEPIVVAIEGVGDVMFRPDKRSKRLSIRLKPFEGVQVIYPPGFPVKSAFDFVNEKKEWIKKARIKMEARESDLTLFDETTQFKSRSFTLKIQKAPRNDVRLHLANGYLNVYYPQHLNVAETPIQEAIRYGIEEALRREAKRYLPTRLRQLAIQNGLRYKQLFVKNLKSRWGSCSGVDNINLNLHLMRLPDHLIDYVLLHELAHTVEKNHGPRFWALLNRMTGGQAKLLAEEMKQHRTKIY